MTLDEAKIVIKNIALSHKDIKEFTMGENFEIGIRKTTDYPIVHLELPIVIDYSKMKSKDFSLALLILTKSKQDDVEQNLIDTSYCEQIADQILQKINAYHKNLAILQGNAITMRNFSDDNLVGVRVEFDVTTGRECDINDYFNA